MLLARQAEQTAIDRLIQRARTGQGGGLVLRGEPGIGKSALLAHAYATLHRLLRPILDQAGCLPEPQTRALRVALGLQAGPAPDRFLVAVAATVRRLVGAAVAARHALGESALLAGRPEEAIEQLEGLLRLVPPGHRGIGLYAVPDLVEAAVRAGQTERGRQWHTRHLAWAEGASLAEARALAARSRALLASGAEADRHFQEALHLHAQTDRLLDHAQTALLYGEFLRRDRRRMEARPPLRTALETFEQLEALAWTQRAQRELRATGQTTRKRHPSNLDQLTPQELQIMRAVGEGLTDREVAAQLFISPRTVDYHLRKIFRKLGIRSRAELIRRPPAGAGETGAT